MLYSISKVSVLPPPIDISLDINLLRIGTIILLEGMLEHNGRRAYSSRTRRHCPCARYKRCCYCTHYSTNSCC